MLSQKTDSLTLGESSPESDTKLSDFILTQSQRSDLFRKQKLLSLYDTYRNDYLPFYVQNLEQENATLKQTFKDVDFYIMSRIKSKHNYKSKILTKGRAQDIFGDKIIILSANGKTDEPTLISVAYAMEIFLTTYNPNISDIPERRKDYIANPKLNGYSSLHITRAVRVPDENISFYRETQIKTFRMRETEKDGPAGHSTVYKANRQFFLSNISTPESAEYFLPLYMHFEFDKKTRSDKLVPESFENRFRYYFGQSYDEFIQQKNSLQK